MKNEIGCLGAECTIKTQCLRYTTYQGEKIRKCNNQRKFVQDTNNINGDSLKR